MEEAQHGFPDLQNSSWLLWQPINLTNQVAALIRHVTTAVQKFDRIKFSNELEPCVDQIFAPAASQLKFSFLPHLYCEDFRFEGSTKFAK